MMSDERIIPSQKVVINKDLITTSADDVKAYIDPDKGLITLMFFREHVVPRMDEKLEFSVESHHYELFLEVKIPLGVVNALSLFITGKVNEFKKQLPPPGRRYFGPTGIKFERNNVTLNNSKYRERLLLPLADIRQKLKRYGDWLDKLKVKIPNSFNMIFNSTTLTLEILSYYYMEWGKPRAVPSSEVERIKKENAERVMEITKWMFIHALSILEYSTKELLKIINEENLPPELKELKNELQQGKRIYLRRIMDKSREAKLIDNEQYRTWEGLIEIRNVIIHNNAIADRTETFKLSDELEVSFSKGEMLKGKLDFFIKLLNITIDRHHLWVRNVLNLMDNKSSIYG